MPYRSDILRGVRLAGVSLAILLVAVLVKRSVKVEATGPPTPSIAEAPLVLQPAPTPEPVVVPDPPGTPEPATPAKPGTSVRTAAIRTNQRRASAPVASVSHTQLGDAGQSLSAPPPAETPTDRTEAVHAEAPAPPPEESPAVAAPQEVITIAPPAPESRGKRLLKAVGRFFRGGKKETAPPPGSKQNQ